MIRPAKISEINEILHLAKACAAEMIKNGIFQWNEYYPSKEAFENDIERSELFVLEKKQDIIGTIVISSYMDEEYRSVEWLTPNDHNVYIHRLSVHPMHQGKGYAQKMMDFAEHFAKKNNFVSIRLDTFSQNRRNQKFYETRGYHRLGDIYFPNQSKHPFHCYEMVL
ncbi:MAG: GNAT family N-acetyltransferase [Maribacter sp.]|nr:GNAT family N-acetyltransferase [Maribacter sp.]